MVITGEPQRIPIKAWRLAEGMLVPVHRLVEGKVQAVTSRVIAVSRSWDLSTVYWQLEDDQPDWCWTTASEDYITVVTSPGIVPISTDR